MIEQIGIVGAGTMGNGIAQCCADGGHSGRSCWTSTTPRSRKVLATIAGSLDRLVKKEKIAAAEKDAVLAHIRTSTHRHAKV